MTSFTSVLGVTSYVRLLNCYMGHQFFCCLFLDKCHVTCVFFLSFASFFESGEVRTPLGPCEKMKLCSSVVIKAGHDPGTVFKFFK